jgi:hypothetical protein
LALILLVACWLSFRRGSDERLGFLLGLGLFKFTLFLPLTLILLFRTPKLLKGYALSASLVTLASIAIIRPAGLVSYARSLLQMARASSAGTTLQFGMDPRLMPQLRGLLYGIVSYGRDSIPASSITLFLVVLFIASVGLLAWTVRQSFVAEYSEGAIDLFFALATIVSVLLSVHLLSHDLVVLAVPFAIVLNHMMAAAAHRVRRYVVLIGLMSLFYPLAVYLLLFAWSIVFLLAVVVLGLALLISKELRDASLEITQRASEPTTI